MSKITIGNPEIPNTIWSFNKNHFLNFDDNRKRDMTTLCDDIAQTRFLLNRINEKQMKAMKNEIRKKLNFQKEDYSHEFNCYDLNFIFKLNEMIEEWYQ